MKFIFTVFAFFTITIVSAQEKPSDKVWLDSLKKITKKDPELFSEKRQSKWADAFISLAQYYEANHSFKQALFYYEKLVDYQFDYLNEYSSDEKLVAKCNQIKRKIAGYYFEGKIVKKDIEKSYWYAFNGTSETTHDYLLFSKRYFNTTGIILVKNDTIDYNKDSVFICTINSFLQKSNVNATTLNDRYLNDIATRYKKISQDSLKFIFITFFSPSCCKNDICRVNRSLGKIKEYFVDKFKIKESDIITNTEAGGGESYSTFNKLKTPLIEIKFAKENPF